MKSQNLAIRNPAGVRRVSQTSRSLCLRNLSSASGLTFHRRSEERRANGNASRRFDSLERIRPKLFIVMHRVVNLFLNLFYLALETYRV